MMRRAQSLANRFGQLVMFQAFEVHPDSVDVMCIFQRVQRTVWNIDDAIDVVVALLHPRRENTHHFKADAVRANRLP